MKFYKNNKMTNFSGHDFYDNQLNFWPMDIYTAASLGDVPFFVKYDPQKLKIDINTTNSEGWTPLMYACARGNSHLVNYLLLLEATRDYKTKSGITSLMLAISSGNLATVESVFDEANLEKLDYRKWTPLFYAVHFAQEKCVTYLINKGANVNIVDFQNETPLMVAIKSGRETMVELILQSATNLTIISFKQESALMLANESNNLKIKSMVRKRHEYLQKRKLEIENKPLPNVPLAVSSPGIKYQSFLKGYSPSLLKKKVSSQIRIGKSFTYSPNKNLESSPQSPLLCAIKNSPWKAGISKKLWSPKQKPFNDVHQFLKVLELERYWPTFRDEEVDFETLLTLNDENLKDLGIMHFGPRKKIIMAIQQIRNGY